MVLGDGEERISPVGQEAERKGEGWYITGFFYSLLLLQPGLQPMGPCCPHSG